jgi:hypothetical protein
VLTSALPVALGVFAFVAIARRTGRSRSAALFAALALALATPMWAYATLMMGHALAGACLLAATLAALALSEPGSPARDLRLGLALGATAGFAVVTEYPALVPASGSVALASFGLRGSLRARGPRVAAGVALAGGACAAVLLGYHQAAFGSPFATPVEHMVFPAVRERPFSLPSAVALREILLGERRGLLPLAPVLLAALPGLWWMLRDPRARTLGVLCAGTIVFYALMNAAFVTPLGGWNYGPRYMGAALPFWALALIWAWDAARRPALRALLVALALYGAGCSLVAVATTAQPPDGFARPMAELLWPAFRDGDLSLNHQSFLEVGADPRRLRDAGRTRDAFNLGELVGLRGHASLAPLAAAWALLAAAGLRRAYMRAAA